MKTKTIWQALALALAAFLLAPAAAASQPISKLVERADMVFRAKTSAAVLRMEIKTKSYQRSYKLVAWDDARSGDKTLIKILGPASWRGHSTLKIGEQLKLFNPKTNHVQVVGHSMLGGSWMGSHLSNDDLVKETRLSRDYDLKLAKKWTASAPVGGSATYYRITMTPKPTAPVAWGRIEYQLWENSDALVPLRADYFRKKGDANPARSIVFSDVKKMAKRYVPAVMRVTLASKPGEMTQLTYTKLKLNVKIPGHKFTEQAMRH